MKTGKAVLFIVLVTSMFHFSLGDVTAQIPGQPIPIGPEPIPVVPVLAPYLSLSIMPLASSDRYPADKFYASTPLILNFVLRCEDGVLANCESGEKFNLYELRYSIMDRDGQVFFDDRVDLYGYKGPGTLEVYPGIDVPLGPDLITVSATLYYQRIYGDGSYDDLTASSTRSGHVALADRGSYYRYSFIKRHILSSGRAMPGMWLKEYEPGKDRKELLYHSRTSEFMGKIRVYVPWIDKCDDFTSPGGCGLSVAEGSDAIYGGGENPLLRNGLAMATFAREYLLTGHIKSLDHAVHLFRYIEKSEWIDPDGNRTGFFLRSNSPGVITESGREYYFASADEIIGMTLGLYYLNRALNEAPSQAPYPYVKTKLFNLVARLGKQLKENYYFIVPLKKVGEYQWVHMDPLPRERHKSWAGGYPFQWFLAGGFKAITGYGYTPPGPPLNTPATHSFWIKVMQLTEKGNSEEIYYALAAINLEKNSRDRAYLTIPGIGLGLYYSEYPLTLSFPFFGSITIKGPKFAHWNLPMLLHAFQFGWADTTREQDARDGVSRLTREVIFGVLQEGGVGMTVNICDIADGFWGGLADSIRTATAIGTGGLSELLGVFEPTLPIGTRTEDADFYAAAVAKAYTLPDTYGSSQEARVKRVRMWSLVTNTRVAARKRFAWDLPVGERQEVSGYIDHNPHPKKIGTTFMWEHGVDSYQQGGEDGSMGLDNKKIKALHDRGYDAMIEGAGLDYLWPDILGGFPWGDIIKCFEPVDVPYFPACSTQPRLMAPSAPATDSPCSFSFRSLEEDAFENNDSYFNAKSLSEGLTNDGLNIDTQTHGAYLGVGYATYTNDDGTYEIPLVADYDYYELVNDEGHDVTVSVHFEYSGKYPLLLLGQDRGDDTDRPVPKPPRRGPNWVDSSTGAHWIKLIVDGEEAQVTDSDVEILGDTFHIRHTKSIRVSGKPKHTIMVTGLIKGYSITTKLMDQDAPVPPSRNKWFYSVHTGMSSPLGSFSNDYDQDHSFTLDLEYLLSKKLALVGLLGYNAFNATSAGVDDTYLINLSANLKYRHPLINSWSTYVAGGPGYYFPEAGGSGMGANIGVGFDYKLNNDLFFEVGCDYHSKFGNDMDFLVTRVGLIFRF